jgi:hypothetical protein
MVSQILDNRRAPNEGESDNHTESEYKEERDVISNNQICRGEKVQ